MTMLIYLIPISILLLALAIGFFVWAVKQGQFDDLDTPALDILQDDQPTKHQAAAVETPPESNEQTDSTSN